MSTIEKKNALSDESANPLLDFQINETCKKLTNPLNDDQSSYKIYVKGGHNFGEQAFFTLDTAASARALGRVGLFSCGEIDRAGLIQLQEIFSNRAYLLSKAKNIRLKNIIHWLYRFHTQYGTGSTADAVRYELESGKRLSPTGHSQKAHDASLALNRLILDRILDEDDKQIAITLRDDLQNALTTKPVKVSKKLKR